MISIDKQDLHFVLIDADSLYFRICCTTTKEMEIRKRIRKEMSRIKREVQYMDEPLQTMIALKGKGNFRDDLHPDYKGKRKPLEPEMKAALTYAIEHMVEEYGAVKSDGMEADDVVSIWAKECESEGHDYTVVHIDKDLDMIPGRHYNFVKNQMYLVHHDAAYNNFMMQCLTGDSVDNIKGVPGLGPKKAAVLLKPHFGNNEKLLAVVKAEWKRAFPKDWEDRFYVDSTLLRMLTDWEEIDAIREYIQDKAAISEPDVRTQRQTNVQDRKVSGVSRGPKADVAGDSLAVREEPSDSTSDSGFEQSGS